MSENPFFIREEDFLTEIFAYTLKTDLVFREAFFSQLPVKYSDKKFLNIQTQKIYPERRPDIEINLEDAVIIIENKVGSEEGREQLPDYAKILRSKTVGNKLLVYITAYRDTKISHEGIDFVTLRWHDIGELVSPKCGDFAKEMNVYLKSEKLIMNNFDSKDLEVLGTLFSTVEKINSIFRDDVSRYFVREMKMHSFINNQPNIEGKEYRFSYNYGKKFTISFGVEAWSEEDGPKCFIRIGFLRQLEDPRSLSEKVHNKLGGNTGNWELLSIGPDWVVVNRKPLLDLMISDEKNQREKICNYFFENIDKIAELKTEFPEIFGNPTLESTTAD